MFDPFDIRPGMALLVNQQATLSGLGQLSDMRGLGYDAQQQVYYNALMQQYERYPAHTETKTEPIKKTLTIREELQEDINDWLKGTL